MAERFHATKPWPEDPAPPGIACKDFGLEGHGRLVWGEGNPAAPVMVILDNPGAREDSAGVPYVCGTRQTLHMAAAAAGWDADSLYVTFLVKCRPRKAYDRVLARQIGLGILKQQVIAKRPSGLILLGDVVVQTLTGNDDNSVRTLRGSAIQVMDTSTVVGYHPLAVRRRPNIYPTLVADLQFAALTFSS